MADTADKAQYHIEREEEARRLLRIRKEQQAKTFTECVDCEVSLSELRQQMKACRCVDCQTEFERESKFRKFKE